MKEVKELLNKKEREIIENIEVYLGLNNLDLVNFDKFKGNLATNSITYQYIYKKEKKNTVILVIEYIFNFSGFVGIYFAYKVGMLESVKVFIDIEEFREFLVEII